MLTKSPVNFFKTSVQKEQLYNSVLGKQLLHALCLSSLFLECSSFLPYYTFLSSKILASYFSQEYF